jgi:hypothetical protein
LKHFVASSKKIVPVYYYDKILDETHSNSKLPEIIPKLNVEILKI